MWQGRLLVVTAALVGAVRRLDKASESTPEPVESNLVADPYQEYREQQRRWVEQVNQHHYEDAQRRHAEAQRRNQEIAEQQRRWVEQVNQHHYEDAQRRHAEAQRRQQALVDTPPKPTEHQDALTESLDLDAKAEGMPESLDAEAVSDQSEDLGHLRMVSEQTSPSATHTDLLKSDRSSHSCTVDLDPDCLVWLDQGHCNPSSEYFPWVKRHCCVTCGLHDSCSDKHASCSAWFDMGYCDPRSDFVRHMEAQCCATCRASRNA